MTSSWSFILKVSKNWECSECLEPRKFFRVLLVRQPSFNTLTTKKTMTVRILYQMFLLPGSSFQGSAASSACTVLQVTAKCRCVSGICEIIFTEENRSIRWKTTPIATVATTKLRRTDLGSKPGLRSGRPATNRLSNDTPVRREINLNYFYGSSLTAQ